MASVKTAISLPEKTFLRAEAEAKNQNLSRSEFMAKAIESYLRRIEAKRIIDAYNEAYADGMTEEELQTLRHFQRLSAKSIMREPW